MTKWEMIHLPNRMATSMCEQFFAFVCQVEWGIPPGEAADLLGCARRSAEAPADEPTPGQPRSGGAKMNSQPTTVSDAPHRFRGYNRRRTPEPCCEQGAADAGLCEALDGPPADRLCP